MTDATAGDARPTPENGKVAPPRRIANRERRTREHLTPQEVEKLIKAASRVGRYGHRDATLILIAYRHGLRVSELAALRWDQIDLEQGLLHISRLKNGVPSHTVNWAISTLLRETRTATESDLQTLFDQNGRIWKNLVLTANIVLRDLTESEDVAQRTCLRVLHRIRHPKPDKSLAVRAIPKFSYKVAYLDALTVYHSRKPQQHLDLSDEEHHPADDHALHALDRAQIKILYAKVRDALNVLSEKEHTVIVLSIHENTDHEIAAAMDINTNYVYQLRHRAYKKLRAVLRVD